jgi:hypothetical protein
MTPVPVLRFTFHEKVVTLRTTPRTTPSAAARFRTTTVSLFRPGWGDTSFRAVRRHRRRVCAGLRTVATMAGVVAALAATDPSSPACTWAVFGACVAGGWAAKLLYEFRTRGDPPGAWNEIHSEGIAIDLLSVVDGTHNAAVIRVGEPVTLAHNLAGDPIRLDKGTALVLVSQMAQRGSIFWDGYTVVSNETDTDEELIAMLRKTWG